MVLIPLAVIFGGYQLAWYGWSSLQGPGMGFLDLLLPSNAEKASHIVNDWGKP